MIVVNEVLGLF